MLTGVLGIGLAEADAYRWQDPDGRVFYGDAPPDGARSVARIATDECHDQACREERLRRFEDMQAINRALEHWLEGRARERAISRSPAAIETPTVYMAPYAVFPPSLILSDHRGAPCRQGIGCPRFRGQRHTDLRRLPDRAPRTNGQLFGFPQTR